MTENDRSTLYAEVSAESRRFLAAYTLFNQALAEHLGLHPTDVQCLSLLTAEPESLTVKQIADMTGLTTGSATRLVDRLERAGYVRRTPDPHDRRRVRVAPIPENLTRVAEVWAELGVGWNAMLTEHTDDELRAITSHMRKSQALSRRQIEYLRHRRDAGQ